MSTPKRRGQTRKGEPAEQPPTDEQVRDAELVELNDRERWLDRATLLLHADPTLWTELQARMTKTTGRPPEMPRAFAAAIRTEVIELERAGMKALAARHTVADRWNAIIDRLNADPVTRTIIPGRVTESQIRRIRYQKDSGK